MMALPGTGRIGYSTPRAIGNTPRRNRMKRRFRAAVMETVRPVNLDMVVAISAKAEAAPYPAILQDLAGAMGRMKERWANELGSS